MNLEILKNKKIIAFDVDSTLAKSRCPIDEEMADLLRQLLQEKKVAIISGGSFVHIKRQVLDKLNLPTELNKNLILLPTNGGGFYTFNEEWTEISAYKFTSEEKNRVIKAIEEVDQGNEELRNNKSYGREIQDRDSEITYSALGEDAPIEIKHAWDPDFKKRMALQYELLKKLPDFEVKIGGTTSIDITPKGMNKAYGIQKLMDYFKLQKEDILFFGDAVYENGNDYPIFLMDIDTIKVINPDETKERLIRLLKNDTI